MIATLERPADIQASVLAPVKAPFTLRTLKHLRAPRPLLGQEADLSPVGDTLLDWYWHGTSVSNLPAIFEHGLLPEKTQHYKRTCLAARSHVAFFWGRLSAVLAQRREDVALIRIPGSMLRVEQLGVEEGILDKGPYGDQDPTIVNAWKKARKKPSCMPRMRKGYAWDLKDWRKSQATFGVVSTDQILRVTPEMVVECPISDEDFTLAATIREMNIGKPVFFEKWNEGKPIVA